MPGACPAEIAGGSFLSLSCFLRSSFFLMAASFVLPSHFIHYASVSPVTLRYATVTGFHYVSIHFSRLSVHRLPIILLACWSPRAAANVPHLHPQAIAGAPHQPCVPIVWHKLRSLSRTLFIFPHLQHRSPPLSYLKLPGFHPRLHSRAARSTVSANRFISFSAPCRMHFTSFHYLQPLSQRSSGLFYLNPLP